MKYFKYAQVDNLTGISVMKQVEINSPTHPQLSGLDVVWTRNDYWFATADDTANGDPDNFIFEITFDQWIAEIQTELQIRKTELINQVDMYQKTLRDKITKDYHYSELVAGLIKIPEAMLAINATTDADADTAAPLLHTEAAIRGITTKQLAQNIINIRDTMMAVEAGIAGTAGKKIDMINAITFDSNSPTACIKEFDVMIDAPIDPKFPGQPVQRIRKYNVQCGWPTI